MDDINIDLLINDFIKDIARLKYNYKKDTGNEKIKKQLNNLNRIIKLWTIMNKNIDNSQEEMNDSQEEINDSQEEMNDSQEETNETYDEIESDDDDEIGLENSLSEYDVDLDNSFKINNLLDISNILLENSKMSKGFKIITKYPYEIS